MNSPAKPDDTPTEGAKGTGEAGTFASDAFSAAFDGAAAKAATAGEQSSSSSGGEVTPPSSYAGGFDNPQQRPWRVPQTAMGSDARWMEAAAEAERQRREAVAAHPVSERVATEMRPGEMHGEIITSFRTNKVAIVLSVDALVLLIDEKLASLRGGERSNEAIAHYENLRLELEALRGVTLRVDAGEAKEEVENTANKFGDFIRKWWEKEHEAICSKTYDTALFALCLSLCGLVGDPVAIVVSGALVGRKTVVDALKTLPKILKRD